MNTYQLMKLETLSPRHEEERMYSSTFVVTWSTSYISIVIVG